MKRAMVALFLTLAVPASLWAQESPALPLAMTLQEPAGGGHDFIDLGAIEVGAVGGIIVYSSDFESDPKFGGGLSLRAPLPWLSGSVLGFERDVVGVFLQGIISSIDREFDQPLEDPQGSAFYATLGLDYTFLHEEGFRLLAQAGLQYASFGSVTDTDNGVGLLIGVAAGVEIGRGIWITLNPQVSFGGGDMLVFGLAGLQVSF